MNKSAPRSTPDTNQQTAPEENDQSGGKDTTQTTPAQREDAIGGRATRGLAALLSQNAITKVVTFASNIVLAKLLIPEHFGVFAIVITVATVAGLAAKLGVKEVLIRRQREFDQLAGPSFWLTVALGAVASIIMAASAWPLAAIYNDNAIITPTLVMALAIFLENLSVPPHAKLQIDLRFQLIAASAFVTTLLRVGLSVALAALGFGAMALVIPYIIVAIIRTAAFWYWAPTPIPAKPGLKVWKSLLPDSTILAATNAPIILSSYTDKAILGFFATSTQIGLYYWAFQLCVQPAVLLGTNLSQILFPTMAKLNNEPERQLDAFVRCARGLAVFVYPMCFILAALSYPLVDALFGPEWLPAVPLMQILSVAFATKCLGWPAVALMTAHGRFRTLIVLSVVTFILSAAGALIGGAIGATYDQPHIGVALGTAAFLVITEPLQLIIGLKPFNNPASRAANAYLPPLLPAIIAAAAAYTAAYYIPQNTNYRPWIQLAAAAPASAIVYTVLLRYMLPNTWNTIILFALRTTFGPIANRIPGFRNAPGLKT